MKVKLTCEIQADIKDKEELESMKENINSYWAMKGIEKLWDKIIKKSVENICPYPTYENKIVKVKAEYLTENKEQQEFQLGDTAYMIDEDFRFFESEVYRIELNKGKYHYDTADCDFELKDIGKWVFKSHEDRVDYIENRFIDCKE